jgi:hypothetical protein
MTASANHESRFIAVLQGGPFDGQEHEIDVADGVPHDTLSLPQTDTEVLANYRRDGSDGADRVRFRFIDDTFA